MATHNNYNVIIFLLRSDLATCLRRTQSTKRYLSYETTRIQKLPFKSKRQVRQHKLPWNTRVINNRCSGRVRIFCPTNCIRRHKVQIPKASWVLLIILVTTWFEYYLVLFLWLNFQMNKTVNGLQTYKRYSSSKPTTEWCSDSEDYVDVELLTSAFRSTNQGRITLKVTAEMTFNCKI